MFRRDAGFTEPLPHQVDRVMHEELERAIWDAYEAMEEPCGKPADFERVLARHGYLIVSATMTEIDRVLNLRGRK